MYENELLIAPEGIEIRSMAVFQPTLTPFNRTRRN